MRKNIAISALIGSAVLAFGTVGAEEDAASNDKSALEGFSVSAGVEYDRQNSEAGDFVFKVTLDGVIQDKAEAVQPSKLKRTNRKLGGSVAFGYGKFFYEDLFVGGEALIDVSKNKRAEALLDCSDGAAGAPDVVFPKITLKSNGVIPSIRLRVGYWIESLRGMFYVTAGASRYSVEFKGAASSWPNGEVALKKIAPVVGLGFQKVLCANISIRLEGDYVFQANKTGSIKTNDLFLALGDTRAHLGTKVRAERFAARLLLNYRI
ncbi:MAG: hypothetical protein LBL99_02605 [Holosporaceae bacterium]|jgi:hypothetical protein|nr:hypothetical protein [Holosporaceae bacterium]